MADAPRQGPPESTGDGPTKTARERATNADAELRVEPSGRPESFNERFARILTNSPAAVRAHRPRERGFLVVVRDTAQLQRAQALCLDPTFTSVSCLTARYRVRPGPAIGTILGAFAGDLQAMRSSDWDPKRAAGDLLPQPGPSPAQSAWDNLVGLDTWDSLFELASPEHLVQAELGPRWMTGFLEALGSHEAVPVGTRLVLFAEIDHAMENASEWTAAIEAILPMLPKRLGIVVSGAPTDLDRPTSIEEVDPHFTLVSADEVPTSAEEGDPTFAYLDSALSGDQPADRDVLEVNRFADALARLVLHKDTKPLTIGIHGPWGSGKSSFMGLIKQGLFRHAPANGANGLRDELGEVEGRLDDYQPERWASHPSDEPVADYLVEADDRRHRLLPEMEKAARRNVITVDFNAWQYDSETQIWAGLASEITRSLEAAMPWHRRWLLRLRYALGRRTSEVIVGLLVPVVAVIVVLALLSRVAMSEATGSKILGDLAGLSTILPGGLLVLIVLAWRTVVVAVPVSQRILKDAKGPDYASQTGLQSQVIDDLAFVSAQLQPGRMSRPSPKARKAPEPPPRVVVFIDDLDRCSDEKVVDILQAINLILGRISFYVFLGMDTDMIYRAIDARYKVGDTKGQADFSESYLRKIVQLSFHLPVADDDERFSLVQRMFSPAARKALGIPVRGGGGASAADGANQAAALGAAVGAQIVGVPSAASTGPSEPGADGGSTGLDDVFRFDRSIVLSPRVLVLKEVEDTEDELRAFREFSRFMSPNPREIKRLVNVHRLVRILLVRPETPLTKPTQRKLVAWLIFSARWPSLVDDILRLAKAGAPGDCVLALATGQDDATSEELTAFSTQLGREGAITADDLQDGQLLPCAALISQLVRDIPAEPPPTPEAASASATG